MNTPSLPSVCDSVSLFPKSFNFLGCNRIWNLGWKYQNYQIQHIHRHTKFHMAEHTQQLGEGRKNI